MAFSRLFRLATRRSWRLSRMFVLMVEVAMDVGVLGTGASKRLIRKPQHSSHGNEQQQDFI